MNEQTKALIEGQLASYRLLESIKISDTVHSWLNMLNRVIDLCNVVDYPLEEIINSLMPGTILAKGTKVAVNSRLNGVVYTNAAVLQSSLTINDKRSFLYQESDIAKGSTIKAGSVINYSMLHEDVVTNAVWHLESPENAAAYSNVFGFMTSTDKFYLDGLKNGIFPVWKNEEGEAFLNDENEEIGLVDFEARKLNVLHSASKTASVRAINSSAAASNGSVNVNPSSPDIQCINAKSDVELVLAAASKNGESYLPYYSEKIISIMAQEDISIYYSGNNWSFVNGSIYPNVEWTALGVQKSTLLLNGMFMVLKATFIHGRILLEVVENTQLIDNYKSASAKHENMSFNGDVIFDANARVLSTLSEMCNGEPESKTFYIHHNEAISSAAAMSNCAASFELNCTTDERSQWESVSLKCRPVASGAFIDSNAVQLQNGRHMAELWTNDKDRSMVVKVDYVLNMKIRYISILGFSVISLNSGRIYDE